MMSFLNWYWPWVWAVAREILFLILLEADFNELSCSLKKLLKERLLLPFFRPFLILSAEFFSSFFPLTNRGPTTSAKMLLILLVRLLTISKIFIL
jgi:hypothetical protein